MICDWWFAGELSVVDWSKLTNLEILFLSENSFSGNVIWTSSGMSNMINSVLVVSIGSLPASLGDCKSLQHLDVRYNKLTGL